MKLGIGVYFADTEPYGTCLQDVKGWTDFTFVEAETRNHETDELEWWMHGSEQGFVRAMKRAVNKGLWLHVNIQDSDPEKIIALAAPYWDSVELVDVEDEPELRKFAMHRRCTDIRQAIRDAGLRLHPIGAVFTASEIRHGNGWQANGLDWIGVEAYVAPEYQTSIAIAKTECRRVLREQLDALPSSKSIVVVSQAFSRHGAWKNEASLAALQDETYRVARPDPRVTHLRFFNWARSDGALFLPKVKARLKAIAKQEAA